MSPLRRESTYSRKQGAGELKPSAVAPNCPEVFFLLGHFLFWGITMLLNLNFLIYSVTIIKLPKA